MWDVWDAVTSLRAVKRMLRRISHGSLLGSLLWLPFSNTSYSFIPLITFFVWKTIPRERALHFFEPLPTICTTIAKSRREDLAYLLELCKDILFFFTLFNLGFPLIPALNKWITFPIFLPFLTTSISVFRLLFPLFFSLKVKSWWVIITSHASSVLLFCWKISRRKKKERRKQV